MYSSGVELTLAIIAPDVWSHAVETFGTEEKAACWMRTRLSELGEHTPEEVLVADPHSDAVEAVLTRIDYGVYS
jgi:putative toxin-antitoxin system antitoxin component (TIGR02293 family)